MVARRPWLGMRVFDVISMFVLGSVLCDAIHCGTMGDGGTLIR